MENPLGGLMFGAILIGVGYMLQKKGKQLAENGVKTTAKVVDNSDRDDLSYPIVEFSDKNNETHTKTLNSGYRPAKKVGTQIKIIYDSNNTDEVVVQSDFLFKTLPIILFALGGIAALYNLYSLVAS